MTMTFASLEIVPIRLNVILLDLLSETVCLGLFFVILTKM